MCNQCQNVRATIFSEQTQELMCTECFTMLHAKGNRISVRSVVGTGRIAKKERVDLGLGRPPQTAKALVPGAAVQGADPSPTNRKEKV
eukprot:symbB.v1.2.024332.t1/scaffold2294.1/size83139/4